MKSVKSPARAGTTCGELPETTFAREPNLKLNPEQRGKARLPHVSEIRYEDLEEGRYAKSRMYNYSQEGFYFESDLKLEKGEKILVGIKNSPYVNPPGTYACYPVEIQWRRVPERSPFKYSYGVKFCDLQTAAASKCGRSGSDPSEKGWPIHEQRKHPRRNLDKDIQCFTRNRVFEGRLKNIAPSGAFIETRQAFDVGQKLSLVLPFIKKNNSPLVKAEVIWKNREGIGVKFLRLKKAGGS